MKKILIRSLRWCLAKLERSCEDCLHPVEDHYATPSLFTDGCSWPSCRCMRMAQNIRTIRGLD